MGFLTGCGTVNFTAIVIFCLLLMLQAGCGNKNHPKENVILPQETSDQLLTQKPADAFTPTQTPQPKRTPAPTAIASLAITNQPNPTATSTPQYPLDLSGYDPDLYGPVDVLHNPPLIVGSEDTTSLVFDFANKFCMQYPIDCIPDGILYYTYGEAEVSQAIPLAYEIMDETEALVARLPATDQEGRSLRYYAEFSVPEVGYTTRYPGAGTIDLFTAEHFILVQLPAENAVQAGKEVYDFLWGDGPDEVGQATYEGFPQRVGPPAMDVADDGRIAVLDPVNQRIILFTPNEMSYSSYPMPFAYGFWADLAFDHKGRLMVCDYQGEENDTTLGPDPYCYLMNPDGELKESTPVYVRSPSKITKALKILDYSDLRLLVPFNSEGQANSREIQRQKEAWDYPKGFVEGQDPFVARFADVKQGLAFEVHSVSSLGAITDFEKTPQGYILVFSGDRIRAAWIDPAGHILKDVTLPNGQYSEINFNGQVAVAQDGSLYVMISTERGMEIHYVATPS